ncbi:hypothetical protein [Mycoplasma phocimorsus]|uniref:hypothetical protein n=1 Tax=Mycoplasma phocimorsus TaxID=3045839 RepID=UPI0024BFD2E3|nr:hypothetical protein [Mycoplasma phocimorsus]MDJ1646109.1 hypothetical protein [Mycoplasma phocimorsus]MDJ1647683.1 hypothetical protein [Mycoplasma phocimorsus]
MNNTISKNSFKIFTTLLLTFTSLSPFLLSVKYQNSQNFKAKQKNIKIKEKFLVKNKVEDIYIENNKLKLFDEKIQENQEHITHKIDALLRVPDVMAHVTTKASNPLFSSLFGFFSRNCTAIFTILYGVVGLATFSGLGYTAYKAIKDDKDRKNAAKELEEDLKVGTTYTFKFYPDNPYKTDGNWKIYKWSKTNGTLENLNDFFCVDDYGPYYQFKYNGNGQNNNNRFKILFEKKDRCYIQESKENAIVYDGYSYDIYLWNFYGKNNKGINLYDWLKNKHKFGRLVLKDKTKNNIKEISIKISSK